MIMNQEGVEIEERLLSGVTVTEKRCIDVIINNSRRVGLFIVNWMIWYLRLILLFICRIVNRIIIRPILHLLCLILGYAALHLGINYINRLANLKVEQALNDLYWSTYNRTVSALDQTE